MLGVMLLHSKQVFYATFKKQQILQQTSTNMKEVHCQMSLDVLICQWKPVFEIFSRLIFHNIGTGAGNRLAGWLLWQID